MGSARVSRAAAGVLARRNGRGILRDHDFEMRARQRKRLELPHFQLQPFPANSGMPVPTPQILILAGNPELQDRLEVFSTTDKLIIAIADGAGGLSGAAHAAETVIRIAAEKHLSLAQPDHCHALLQEADNLISNSPTGGETTAIILVIEPDRIFGASVGDSEAWLFAPPTKTHLTKSQQQKPLLGSSEALPIAFDYPTPRGTLIIATDGLWKYTSPEKIAAQLQLPEPSTLPNRLADLVRLRSGALQDDLAIAIIPLP
jgi:PPM family protein phosphatase